eukprot:654590-Pleurochrysis_carterae.AAC.2
MRVRVRSGARERTARESARGLVDRGCCEAEGALICAVSHMRGSRHLAFGHDEGVFISRISSGYMPCPPNAYLTQKHERRSGE